MERPESIEIPLRGGTNEVVEVLTSELPEDPSEIHAIVASEGAPLELYLAFAIEYYYRKRVDAFKYLLREGLAECNRRGERKADVPLLTALAAFYIALGLSSTATSTLAPDGGNEHFEEATRLLNEAERRDQGDMRLLLRKGLLLLAQRRLGAAEYQLRMVLGRDPENVIAQVALGCAAFLGNNWEGALVSFTTVLRRLTLSSSAAGGGLGELHLAMASCLLRAGREEAAQAIYEQIISTGATNDAKGEEQSSPPPSEPTIRQRDRDHSTLINRARTSLAVIYLNRASRTGSATLLSEGLRLLKSAYEADRANAVALLHLANHFFFRHDYGKALSLVKTALGEGETTAAAETMSGIGGVTHSLLPSTPSPMTVTASVPSSLPDSLRADLHYVAGKTYHVQGQWEEAFSSYSEAARLNSQLSLAHFGLGQVCLARGDAVFAKSCFERVLELARAQVLGDASFWTMLGLVSGEKEHLEQAASLSARSSSSVTASMASGSSSTSPAGTTASFELQVALAALYESHQQAEPARMAYEQAQVCDPDRFKASIPLLLNYGVCLHRTGALEAALAISDQCLLLLSSPSSSVSGGGHQQLYELALFNRARLLEELGREGEAEALYHRLIGMRPGEATYHLRLGQLCARHVDRLTEASEHFKEAIQDAPVGQDEPTGNADAWILLAWGQLKMRALMPARKAFERHLRQTDRHDSYALVALGTIYVEMARSVERTGRKEYFKRALEFYIKALSLERANIVAAHGVGVILAELGRWAEAKEVFQLVRLAGDTSLTGREAALNLAHCQVELGQTTAAIHIYEQQLQLANEGGRGAGEVTARTKASLHLYAARAHYILAKTERAPEGFERAQAHLKQATELLPATDQRKPLLFNIALSQQEMAAGLLRQRGGEEEADLQRALVLGKSSLDTFTQLLEMATLEEPTTVVSGNAHVDRKLLEQRLKYAKSLQSQIERRANSLQADSQARRERLEAVRRERQAQAAEEAARQAQEEEARRREQERSEQIRKELAARLRLTEERIRAVDDQGESSAGETDTGKSHSDTSEDEDRGTRIGRRRDINAAAVNVDAQAGTDHDDGADEGFPAPDAPANTPSSPRKRMRPGARKERGTSKRGRERSRRREQEHALSEHPIAAADSDGNDHYQGKRERRVEGDIADKQRDQQEEEEDTTMVLRQSGRRRTMALSKEIISDSDLEEGDSADAGVP